ncbi:hypothetical protein K438DRAFT_2110089 [Mycena galopus ATCC 62051]|nr:hypothetical protein K438DRAFT_2110089 [Mycena galopus ATCC 62051]
MELSSSSEDEWDPNDGLPYCPQQKINWRVALPLAQLERAVEAEEHCLTAEKYCPWPHVRLVMQVVMREVLAVGAVKKLMERDEIGTASNGFCYIQLNDTVGIRRVGDRLVVRNHNLISMEMSWPIYEILVFGGLTIQLEELLIKSPKLHEMWGATHFLKIRLTGEMSALVLFFDPVQQQCLAQERLIHYVAVIESAFRRQQMMAVEPPRRLAYGTCTYKWRNLDGAFKRPRRINEMPLPRPMTKSVQVNLQKCRCHINLLSNDFSRPSIVSYEVFWQFKPKCNALDEGNATVAITPYAARTDGECSKRDWKHEDKEDGNLK